MTSIETIRRIKLYPIGTYIHKFQNPLLLLKINAYDKDFNN